MNKDGGRHSPAEPIERQIVRTSEKVVARGEEQTASVYVPVPVFVRGSREERSRLHLSLCVCVCVTLACYLAPEKFRSSVRDP